MCLITNQFEPKLLEEDLVCYKFVRFVPSKPLPKIHSPYCSKFSWTLGKLVETEFSYQTTDWADLSEIPVKGSHEFFTAYDLESRIPYRNCDVISVAEGFHFALTEKRLGVSFGEFSKCAVCIVPKGSLVYFDATGLGVSNKLIMSELIPS